MLPRMFNPVQLNVDCSGKTPMKAAEGKKGRKPRGTKASGESRASRPSSAAGRTGVLQWCPPLHNTTVFFTKN